LKNQLNPLKNHLFVVCEPFITNSSIVERVYVPLLEIQALGIVLDGLLALSQLRKAVGAIVQTFWGRSWKLDFSGVAVNCLIKFLELSQN